MAGTNNIEGRPRVLLVVDLPNWAFDNMAREQILPHLGSEFSLEVVCHSDPRSTLTRFRNVDLMVCFWWPTVFRLKNVIQPRRILTCLYDGHSTIEPANADPWRAVCALGPIAVANDAFCSLVVGDSQVYLCEDSVDTSLFTPRPLPTEFTVGWTGNSRHGVGPQAGSETIKGLELIREACRRAGVPLKTQDVSCDAPRPHDTMPEWYERISCYVCASTSEGGPNPVLEALACGRSVVSTAVGLVPTLCSQGAPAIVVERSIPALTEGIGRFRDTYMDSGDMLLRDARRVAMLHDRKAKSWQWRQAILGALGRGVE